MVLYWKVGEGERIAGTYIECREAGCIQRAGTKVHAGMSMHAETTMRAGTNVQVGEESLARYFCSM